MQRLNISDDGRQICLVDECNRVLWAAGVPPLADWRRLCGGMQSDASLERGVYRWVNGADNFKIVVVFSPYGGLDFNLTYSISSGELLDIQEAR